MKRNQTTTHAADRLVSAWRLVNDTLFLAATMASLLRILLLGSAVVLMVFGVICLREPASVDPNGFGGTTFSNSSPSKSNGAASDSPTVLAPGRMENGDAWDSNVSPRFVDQSPNDSPTLHSRGYDPSVDNSFVDETTFTNPSPTSAFPPTDPDDESIGQPVQNFGTSETPPRETLNTHSTMTTLTGENWWSISTRLYGSPEYFKALYAYNRHRVVAADQLVAGTVLLTPPLDELTALFPTLIPSHAQLP